MPYAIQNFHFCGFRELQTTCNEMDEKSVCNKSIKNRLMKRVFEETKVMKQGN